MNINALHYFSVVAEKLSFQEAAKQLVLPRSTLSRKITELETALGTQLLNRTTRQVSLTETGRLIYEQCQRMDEMFDNVVSIAQNSQKAPSGLLKVTIPVTLGRMMFSHWLLKFHQAYPDIRLDISLSDTYENLVENQIDIAIRVGELQNSSLISRKIGSTARWLICSSDFKNKFKPETIEQLQNLPLISMKTRQMSGDRWKLTSMKVSKFVDIKPAVQVNDMTAMVEMIRLGLGVGLVPYFVAESLLKKGELVRVLPEYEGEEAVFHLIYQKRENMPLKLRVFIDFIVEAIRAEASLQIKK